jgi:hypothetical protein
VAGGRDHDNLSFAFLRQRFSVTLEIPVSVVLADGSVALVKSVSASVVDETLTDILYVVETKKGAWTEVRSEDVRIEPLERTSE